MIRHPADLALGRPPTSCYRGAMHQINITCPHCGEDFQVPCDTEEGTAEFVVDCEVCCRPMTVAVQVRGVDVVVTRVSAD